MIPLFIMIVHLFDQLSISVKVALDRKEFMMIPKQTDYKVGIYLRLSRDDERQGESLSIENQRRVLTN